MMYDVSHFENDFSRTKVLQQARNVPAYRVVLVLQLLLLHEMW